MEPDLLLISAPLRSDATHRGLCPSLSTLTLGSYLAHQGAAVRVFDPTVEVDTVGHDASSAAVLGTGLDLDEDAPAPAPATAYLSGKLALEERAAAVGAIVVRPSYLYGPGHPPLTVRGREPRLHHRLRAGEVLELPDDGALPLQPLFAADYAAAVAAILAEPHPAPRYHVAGPATTWRGWLTALADAAGVPLRTRAVPAAELTASSFWFRDYLRHALTIRSTRLPPLAFTPLAEGARALIAWLDRVTPPG